jgi:hypothetical protein
MADLFGAAPAAAQRKAPSLHDETEIYRAVEALGAHLLRMIAGMRNDIKRILGDALLFEAAEMAELVRRANIARGADKLPVLDELLGRLEKIQYLLRVANSAQFLPHSAYANSIPITQSIGRQANGLKNRFHAPAPSPAT